MEKRNKNAQRSKQKRSHPPILFLLEKTQNKYFFLTQQHFYFRKETNTNIKSKQSNSSLSPSSPLQNSTGVEFYLNFGQ